MISRSLWESALELQSFLTTERLDFAFIGGLAIQRWGQPRMTDDIDVTVVVPFGQETELAKRVLRRYQSRHPQPLSFVLEARILLLSDIAGFDIDMSVGGMIYEQRLIERSSSWAVPGGGEIRTSSAEDLVVMKCFADRPLDWVDVKSILQRQTGQLDTQIIVEELTLLAALKEAPELVTQLQSLLEKYH